MVRILVSAALLSLVGGGISWYRGNQIEAAYTRKPARHPITLEEGTTVEFEFTTDIDADYWIVLDVARSLPTDQIDALLGIRFGHEDPKPYIQWKVTEGGKEVAVIPSPGLQGTGTWGPRIGKLLGSIKCAAGHRYLFRGTVVRSILDLSVADPHIQIEITPLVFKGAMGTVVTLQIVAVVLLVLSLALSVISLFVWKMRRGQGGHSETKGIAPTCALRS